MKSSRKRYKMNVNVKVFLWGETFGNIHTLVLCFHFYSYFHEIITSHVHCFSKEMTSFTSLVGRVDM